MTQDNNEIIVCRTTRRNMSFGLLWPGESEELDYGRWYFIKIFIYSLITITNLGISWTHFYVGLKSNAFPINSAYHTKYKIYRPQKFESQRGCRRNVVNYWYNLHGLHLCEKSAQSSIIASRLVEFLYFWITS
jgi:hypothetical protein